MIKFKFSIRHSKRLTTKIIKYNNIYADTKFMWMWSLSYCSALTFFLWWCEMMIMPMWWDGVRWVTQALWLVTCTRLPLTMYRMWKSERKTFRTVADGKGNDEWHGTKYYRIKGCWREIFSAILTQRTRQP